MALKTQGHWVSKKEPKIPVNGKPKTSHLPKKETSGHVPPKPETTGITFLPNWKSGAAILSVNMDELIKVELQKQYEKVMTGTWTITYDTTPIKSASAATHIVDYSATWSAEQLKALKAQLPLSPPGYGSNAIIDTLEHFIPGLREMTVPNACPAADDETLGFGWRYRCAETNLTRLIIHLNDEHMWTREQIADWLDSLDLDLSFKFDTTEEVNDDQHADH